MSVEDREALELAYDGKGEYTMSAWEKFARWRWEERERKKALARKEEEWRIPGNNPATRVANAAGHYDLRNVANTTPWKVA